MLKNAVYEAIYEMLFDLNVQVDYVKRIGFDKLPTRLNLITHQNRKYLV